MNKEITGEESVRIDRELSDIPKIIEKYSGYFFSDDPQRRLVLMKEGIDDIFERIFIRNNINQ